MHNPTNHITRRMIPAGLAVLTALLLLSAPTALASEACPNEQIRRESNINPATGQPYDLSLPECRAYEMVSPLEKQAHRAEPTNTGVPVAPDGNVIGFQSEGAFAEPGNVPTTTAPLVEYLSKRTPSGWITEGIPAPANLIAFPTLSGLSADFAPDLTSEEISCGKAVTEGGGLTNTYRCAFRDAEGTWETTPTYTNIEGNETPETLYPYLGSSADNSRIFIQLESPLLPGEPQVDSSGGIYEISGVGTPTPQLRLVTVSNDGQALVNGNEGPLFGDQRESPAVKGTAYHAISESGETLFFTATPPEGVQTVYARVGARETVAVSDPSPAECTTCEASEQSATYQGASANGEKVFFTTTQQLLNADTDKTTDLYEYDFAADAGHHLIQLSGGGLGDLTPGSGAGVQGVVRTSSDGSHVYFVATGVLTSLPNSLDQFAQSGADNLYGVNTDTGETKFVGEMCSDHELSGSLSDSQCPTTYSDAALWGEEDDATRDAQTTPDGDYFVFSTYAHLAAGEDQNEAQAVYRYDFDTGEVAWISHAASGYTVIANAGKGEASNVVIAPLYGRFGGERDTNDFNRAISEDGEYIIFTTAEKLQADDTNGASDIYLWHHGTVSMVSDGESPVGVDLLQTGGSAYAALSASGSDIFFFTTTQLVGQDSDVLQDLYDARVNGGFAAPAVAPSCTDGEWTCQGKASEQPVPPKSEGSSTQAPGQNLIAPPFKELVEPITKSKSKPLTNAQKLAAALKTCKKTKSKAKRRGCEKAAQKKFSPKPKKKGKGKKKR
jgi:hypothetical protein